MIDMKESAVTEVKEEQKLPDVPILEIVLVESGELVLRISKDLVPHFSKLDATKITAKFEQLSKILYRAGENYTKAQSERYKLDLEKFTQEMKTASENSKQSEEIEQDDGSEC